MDTTGFTRLKLHMLRVGLEKILSLEDTLSSEDEGNVDVATDCILNICKSHSISIRLEYKIE